MDSSDGDFALLLLAEKQDAISEKNWRTNKRTSKHTNATQIIVLREVISVVLRDYHSIDQSLDRSVKIQSINRSIAIDQSLDRSIERKITQSIYHPVLIDHSNFRSVNHSINQLIDHRSINLSIDRDIDRDRAINRPINRSSNQSITAY